MRKVTRGDTYLNRATISFLKKKNKKKQDIRFLRNTERSRIILHSHRLRSQDIRFLRNTQKDRESVIHFAFASTPIAIPCAMIKNESYKLYHGLLHFSLPISQLLFPTIRRRCSCSTRNTCVWNRYIIYNSSEKRIPTGFTARPYYCIYVYIYISTNNMKVDLLITWTEGKKQLVSIDNWVSNSTLIKCFFRSALSFANRFATFKEKSL